MSIRVIYILIVISTFLNGCKQENKDRSTANATYNSPKVTFNPNLYFKHYGVNDGLISTDLLNIYNDKKGYTWIATGKAIVRFDGVNFKNYFSDLEKGVHLDGAAYFYEDSKGTFWVLSGAGYLNYYDAVIDDFVHKKTKLEGGWSTENPMRILEDANANFWFGGYGGLQYFDRSLDTVSVYPIKKIRALDWPHEEKVRFEVVQKDQNGNLWAGTRKFGLVKFDLATKTYDFIRDRSGYKSVTLDDWVTDIIPADSGRFWIADYNVGLILFDPITEEIVESMAFKEFAKGRPNIYIRDILKEDNLLMLGTERSGLIIYDSQKRSVIRQYHSQTQPYLAGDLVIRTVIDQNANLWMVGDKLTLGSSSLFDFEKLDLPSSIKNKSVYDINASENGDLLISTPSQTAFYDQSNQTVHAHSYLTPTSTRNYGTLITRDHRKFTSDEHQIIQIEPLSNKILQKLDTHQRLDTLGNSLRRATRFLEDAQGTIWTIDHWGRLKFIKPKEIGNIFALAQDPETEKFIKILCFLDDPKNKRIIVGTDLGIAAVSYENHDVSWFKLNSQKTDFSKSIFSYLYRDKKGVIWSLIEGGLYTLDLDKNQVKGFNDIPTLENVKWIVEEPVGTYWLNTNIGILRFIEDTKQTTSFENNNFSEGSSIMPSPVVVTNGKIYFGGDEGVSVIDPVKFAINPNAPNLYITQLSYPFKNSQGQIRDTAINVSNRGAIELAYFQNDLIFSYEGIEYKNPQRNTYSFFLEGYDQDWIQVGSQQDAIYTNISPGTYTLKVNAANSDGVWTAQPATFTVTINPPWWKTWWAYCLYLVLAAAVIYAWIRFQVYQKTLRYKINERLRTKISSDLHDEVGTILSGLAMKSELMSFTANDKDQKELTSISDMSKDAMERMRDTVWAIDSRKDNYENLFDKMKEYAQDHLSFKNIGFQFNTEKVDNSAFISPEKRQNTYLIFKEAIANILKHSDATIVKIDAILKGNDFQLSIKDNGNAVLNKVSAGQGTSNMKMRAEKMGGQLEYAYDNGFQVMIQFPIN